jgi:hypothetical protein
LIPLRSFWTYRQFLLSNKINTSNFHSDTSHLNISYAEKIFLHSFESEIEDFLKTMSSSLFFFLLLLLMKSNTGKKGRRSETKSIFSRAKRNEMKTSKRNYLNTLHLWAFLIKISFFLLLFAGTFQLQHLTVARTGVNEFDSVFSKSQIKKGLAIVSTF